MVPRFIVTLAPLPLSMHLISEHMPMYAVADGMCGSLPHGHWQASQACTSLVTPSSHRDQQDGLGSRVTDIQDPAPSGLVHAQVDEGILGEDEVEECIGAEFNPVRAGFAGGEDVWTRDVLNLGVRPDKLIAKVHAKHMRGALACVPSARAQCAG